MAASLDLRSEPNTVVFGKGLSMIFLRDSPYLVRTIISGEEPLKVPPHWHETHEEIHRVVKGRVKYTLGEPGARLPGSPNAKYGSRTHMRVIGPEDGEVVVPPGTIHALETFLDEECEVLEKTNPMDEEKEVFFRNLFAAGGLSANPIAVFQAFYWGDGFPVLPGGGAWLERQVVTWVGYYLAPMLGFKLKYDISKPKNT